MASRLESLLGKNGPLAAQLTGFAHRHQQVALAQAVEKSLNDGRVCLAEAGTGVGKTLAYLVPLVRWLDKHGGRAIISTHTLALQAQLVERDIPTLLSALPELDIRAAALKGRSNFLCLQDMDIAAGELWTAGDPQFLQIRRWANETDSGDRAELDFTFPNWSEISANADTCRQRECRYYERCFYFKARKNAEECNLLVVNHALFFADLRLRLLNPNGPSLLPKYDAVVFDEAHHVDDTATRAFGLEWGSRRVPQLTARVRRLREATLSPGLLPAMEALNQVVLDPFIQSNFGEAFFEEAITNDADLQSFAGRVTELTVALDTLARELISVAEDANEAATKERAAGLARTATRISVELGQVTTPDEPDEDNSGAFRWFNVRRMRNGQSFATLVKTPLTIDETLNKVLFFDTPRVIFASATLAANGGFTFLKNRLGLNGTGNVPPVEIIEGSPFDFEKNCLLYIPRRLGPPRNDDTYTDLVADEVRELVEISQGRAFCLFTSYRMLRAVQDRLHQQTPYPLFVQGEQPNARLVDAFIAAGNGVLLGTSSFWEGVDVPGSALSLVIMDKLPFAAPDSPVQRAREKEIIEKGGDAFREFSMPQAALRLKQGFGRLLRSVNDRGVVAILDSRLWTKSYGREFLNDLPPSPRTDQIGDVARFFTPASSETLAPSEANQSKLPTPHR